MQTSIGQKFRLKKQLIKVGIRSDHADTKENTGATQSQLTSKPPSKNSKSMTMNARKNSQFMNKAATQRLNLKLNTLKLNNKKPKTTQMASRVPNRSKT